MPTIAKTFSATAVPSVALLYQSVVGDVVGSRVELTAPATQLHIQ